MVIINGSSYIWSSTMRLISFCFILIWILLSFSLIFWYLFIYICYFYIYTHNNVSFWNFCLFAQKTHLVNFDDIWIRKIWHAWWISDLKVMVMLSTNFNSCDFHKWGSDHNHIYINVHIEEFYIYIYILVVKTSM